MLNKKLKCCDIENSPLSNIIEFIQNADTQLTLPSTLVFPTEKYWCSKSINTMLYLYLFDLDNAFFVLADKDKYETVKPDDFTRQWDGKTYIFTEELIVAEIPTTVQTDEEEEEEIIVSDDDAGQNDLSSFIDHTRTCYLYFIG